MGFLYKIKPWKSTAKHGSNGLNYNATLVLSCGEVTEALLQDVSFDSKNNGDGSTSIYLVGGLVAIFYFPINIGFLIIPIDELIFFRGVAQPPTRFIVSSNSMDGHPQIPAIEAQKWTGVGYHLTRGTCGSSWGLRRLSRLGRVENVGRKHLQKSHIHGPKKASCKQLVTTPFVEG